MATVNLLFYCREIHANPPVMWLQSSYSTTQKEKSFMEILGDAMSSIHQNKLPKTQKLPCKKYFKTKDQILKLPDSRKARKSSCVNTTGIPDSGVPPSSLMGALIQSR